MRNTRAITVSTALRGQGSGVLLQRNSQALTRNSHRPSWLISTHPTLSALVYPHLVVVEINRAATDPLPFLSQVYVDLVIITKKKLGSFLGLISTVQVELIRERARSYSSGARITHENKTS